MIKNFAYTLLLATLVACKGKSTETTTTDATTTTTDYTCVPLKKAGRILPNHAMADIEQLFGKENIGIDSMFAEGEFVGLRSVVNKAKADEIFISWEEDKPPFKKIMSVEVTQPNSPYKTEEGIGVGSTVADIQAKLNDGKPFTFSGFGWDYGGGCCFGEGISEKLRRVSFRLDMQENDYQKFTEDENRQFIGDQSVPSDLPIFKQKAMPVVMTMMVTLNEYQSKD
jgi:hypothetical protein